jgi:hypothetical protein
MAKSADVYTLLAQKQLAMHQLEARRDTFRETEK